jgi:hypothetical protein
MIDRAMFRKRPKLSGFILSARNQTIVQAAKRKSKDKALAGAPKQCHSGGGIRDDGFRAWQEAVGSTMFATVLLGLKP